MKSTDNCPEEVKLFISRHLENCKPSSQDLTWVGRKLTRVYLDRNDYLGSLLAIDGNTKKTKRAMCIFALKTAAKCICDGYKVEELRAGTYSYLASRQLD